MITAHRYYASNTMIELRMLDGLRGYFKLRLHSVDDAMRLVVALRGLSLGITFNTASDTVIVVKRGAVFNLEIEKIAVSLGLCRLRFFVPKGAAIKGH